MHAAIHLPEEPRLDEAPEKKPYKVLRFDVNAEPPQKSPPEKEVRLRAEVRALQAELQQVQRQLTQSAALLRNARLREQELRAELLKQK